jgi:Bifunctional DNA primase/polymerase, N-terminal
VTSASPIMMPVQASTALRLQLLRNGYTPLPLVGKAIKIRGWQNLKPTQADIENWAWEYPVSTNTGIATRHTPAIDVDILDEAVAEHVYSQIEALWGSPLLRRFGRAPKHAVLFHTDQPFKKLQRIFTAPDEATHKIEILGDGQQLAAFGTHPDTRQPYRWTPCDPTKVARSDLPPLCEDAAKCFLEDMASQLKNWFGWTATEPKQSDYRPPLPALPISADTMRSRIDGIVRTISSAQEGTRNQILFWGASRLGEMVDQGSIAIDTAIALAIDAARQAGLQYREAISTTRSALRRAP